LGAGRFARAAGWLLFVSVVGGAQSSWRAGGRVPREGLLVARRFEMIGTTRLGVGRNRRDEVANHRVVFCAKSICALLAGLAVIWLGSSMSAAVSTARSDAAKPARAATLTRFLVRAGEEPGFTPGRPHVAGSLRAYVRYLKSFGPPKQVAADAKRLKAEGFVAAAWEHTTNNPESGVGQSYVREFATSIGAGHERAFIVHVMPGHTKFGVTGIPGAYGRKGKVFGDERYANLVWRQGRCTLSVGESFFPRTTAAPTRPLIAAAQAIYRRTGGTCP
jgi:hypothetical protein